MGYLRDVSKIKTFKNNVSSSIISLIRDKRDERLMNNYVYFGLSVLEV